MMRLALAWWISCLSSRYGHLGHYVVSCASESDTMRMFELSRALFRIRSMWSDMSKGAATHEEGVLTGPKKQSLLHGSPPLIAS